MAGAKSEVDVHTSDARQERLERGRAHASASLPWPLTPSGSHDAFLLARCSRRRLRSHLSGMSSYQQLESSPRGSSSSLRALELSPPSSPPPRLRTHRSDTITGFDFAFDPMIIPLSSTREEGFDDGSGEPEKHVGLVNGTLSSGPGRVS